MTTWRTAVLALQTAVCLSAPGLARVAAAGCTGPPEQPVFYRGVRGSIDRPFVTPGSDDLIVIRLGTDEQAPRLRDFNGDGEIDAADVTITAVFKPTGTDIRPTLTIAPSWSKCAQLEPERCWLERLLCHSGPTCVEAEEAHLMVAADAGPGQIGFRFPESEFAGAIAIAVTPVDVPLPDLEQAPCAVLLDPKRARSDLIAYTALACIDEFIPDQPPGAPTPTSGSTQLSFTQLIAAPQTNDFQQVCDATLDGQLPACDGNANVVRLTAYNNGDVMIPMSWANILQQAPAGGRAPREMRGSSPVGAFYANDVAVHIPNARFLESVTKFGTQFLTKPKFVPDSPPDRPNELTLLGTADKEESRLLIRARVQSDTACSGGGNDGQACEDAADCPGGTCGSRTPTYFFCDGGARNLLPCTRPAQCPGGTGCKATSVCIDPYATTQPPTSTPCASDANCTGQHMQCGKGLFEFRHRLSGGVGTIPRSGTGNNRGVCNGGANEGGTCSGDFQCNPGYVFGTADCVAFRAEAGVPTPTP